MTEQMPEPQEHHDSYVGRDMNVVHHKSVRSRRERPPVNMVLNVTPVLDVIFLLLIYFVITANFAIGEGVVVAKLPEGTGPAPVNPLKREKKLFIRISSSGSSGDPTGYVIDVRNAGGRAPKNFKQLKVILDELQLHDRNESGTFKPDDPVIIKPARDVRWQHVVNAFNAAMAARYSNIRFSPADE